VEAEKITPKKQTIFQKTNNKYFILLKMDPNTIGVLSTEDDRSVADKNLLSQFSCSSRENYDENILNPRSIKDQMMLKQFGCQKENFKSNFQMKNNKETYCNGMQNEINNPFANPYNTSENVKMVPL
jgi:hypothetical protein